MAGLLENPWVAISIFKYFENQFILKDFSIEIQLYCKGISGFDVIQEEIINLLKLYDCYPNPVVWGGGDAELLKKELLENVGYVKIFGHREIDIKTLHTFHKISKNEKTNSSLSTAMNAHKIKFDGNPHRAVDDARNTLSLFFTMILKQQVINNLISEAAKLK